MIYLNFVISLLVLIFFILSDAKLLQEQYYSLTRLFLLKNKTFYKEIASISIFLIASYLIYTYYDKNWGILLMSLSQYLLVTEFKLRDYHFTRRMVILLSFSIIICLIFYFYIYFYFDSFLAVSTLFLIGIISLILGYFLTWPIEKIIREYYIKKAKNKILKNNYIIIGITGSFGKTTMKNLLYSILKTKYKISKQNHNYNTVLGLAKYINNDVTNDDDILILELGVDKLGSMKKFKKIFTLDYAIITSIGNMHLATFKNLENIKKEKLKIKDLLNEDGKLFINKDDVNVSLANPKVIFSSFDEMSYLDTIPYRIVYKEKELTTPLYLKYQLSYLSLCLKIAKEFNLTDEEIIYGLTHLQIPSRRFNVKKIGNDIIIDNSYNSNEKGFKESIDLILKFNKYKIVITGGLIELGEKHNSVNYEIGKSLKDVDLVVLVSSNNSHPLKEGFVSFSKNKIIQIADFKKVQQIVDNIKEEKIILYNSIGIENFLN